MTETLLDMTNETQRAHASLQRLAKQYRKHQEDNGISVMFRGIDLEQLDPSKEELLGVLHHALEMLAAERENHDFSLELMKVRE